MLWNSEGTEDHHFICLLGLLEGTLDLCQTGERSNSMCIWCASQSVSVSLCLYIHLATCLLLCVSYLEKWAKVICQLLTPWTALTPFQRFSEIKVSESGETVFPGKLRNLCQLEWLAFNIDYPLREPLTSLQFYQQAESFCKICSPQTCCLYSGFMLPGSKPPSPKNRDLPCPCWGMMTQLQLLSQTPETCPANSLSFIREGHTTSPLPLLIPFCTPCFPQHLCQCHKCPHSLLNTHPSLRVPASDNFSNNPFLSPHYMQPESTYQSEATPAPPVLLPSTRYLLSWVEDRLMVKLRAPSWYILHLELVTYITEESRTPVVTCVKIDTC